MKRKQPQTERHQQTALWTLLFLTFAQLIAEASDHKTIQLPEAKTASAVAWMDDGPLLAVASSKDIWLYDMTGAFPFKLTGHTRDVKSLHFNPTGKILASGSADETIRLWDVEKRRQMARFRGYTGTVNAVCFSPDGNTLASGSADGFVWLWNVTTKKNIARLGGRQGSVNAVDFSPDGQLLAWGSLKNTVWVWDIKRHRVLEDKRNEVAEFSSSSPVNTVAFSPNGQLLAYGLSDNTIRLWDIATRQDSPVVFAGHSGPVNSVSFSFDGRLLASGASDNTVRLWSLPEGNMVKLLTGHMGEVSSVAFNSTNGILASGALDSTIRLWHVPAAAAEDTIPPTVELAELKRLDLGFAAGCVVSGIARDNTFIKNVTVNGEAVTLKNIEVLAGHTVKFSETVPLSEGENTIRVVAVDSNGNQVTETKTLTLPVSDTVPPTVEINEPPQLGGGKPLVMEANTRSIQVAGIVRDNVHVQSVTVNDQAVTLQPHNSQSDNALGHVVEFRTAISLFTGQNMLHIVAVDSTGNQSTQTATITVTLDTRPPTLQLIKPKQLISGKSLTVEPNVGSIAVAGIARDDVKVDSVTIKGESVPLNPIHGPQVEAGHAVQFHTSVPLTEGKNAIPIVLVDSSGNETKTTVMITVPVPDMTPPTVEITQPLQLAGGKSFTVEPTTPSITVAGIVRDNVHVQNVTLNDADLPLKTQEIPSEKANGHVVGFSTTVSLSDGENLIRIVAVDSSQNKTTETMTVSVPLRVQSLPSVVANRPTTNQVGERWALLIGINDYDKNQQGDYYLPNLKACVKDVTVLQTVLGDAQRGGFEHITTRVSNSTRDESDDPTDRNILRDLKNLVNQTEPDDLVIIYFSGHGWQKGNEAYLLPQNFDIEFPNRTAIRSEDLTKLIGQMKAKTVITILDSCHSGGIEVRSKGKAGGAQLTLNRQYQQAFETSAGKIVIHSCDANEKSWELPDGSQGVFSKYLVNGLSGAADSEGDNDGVITLQEAYQYTHTHVIAHMKKDERGSQTPVLSGKLIGKIPLTIDPRRKAQHQLEKQIDMAYTLIADPIVAERAMFLLQKRANQQPLVENEKRLINYLDNFLAGKITLKTYLGADKRFGQ